MFSFKDVPSDLITCEFPNVTDPKVNGTCTILGCECTGIPQVCLRDVVPCLESAQNYCDATCVATTDPTPLIEWMQKNGITV